MDITINEVLVQIADINAGVLVPSISCQELTDYEMMVITTKIKKALALQKRECEINGNVEFNELLKNYQPGTLAAFADTFGNAYFEKRKTEVFTNADLIYVDFRADERDYLLFIDNELKNCITHVTNYEESVVNHLMEYKAVLPKDIGRDDRLFLYDYRSQLIEIREAADHKDILENMFDLSSKPTPNEVIEQMEEKIIEVSRLYEIPVEEAVPEFKGAVLDCEIIKPEEVAKAVFEKSEIAQRAFTAQMENEGLGDIEIPRETVKLPKKNRTMKYVTESGIEVIIPANFLKRKDKIEIINNADGTISISIKNIEKLKNR